MTETPAPYRLITPVQMGKLSYPEFCPDLAQQAYEALMSDYYKAMGYQLIEWDGEN